MPETVDSILNQDYCNLKVVVVDDCSADDTQEVLSKYLQKVTVLRRKTNQGVQIASMT